MKLNKLIDQFNQPDVHLVISRWPGMAKGARFDGIAAYTRNIVTSFAKESSGKFVVLADVVVGEPDVKLVNKNILLIRVFNPKHHTLFPVILTWLKTFSEIRGVFVHADFCASGVPKFALMEIPFLLMIRLMHRNVTYYAHNVIDDKEVLAGQLQCSPRSPRLYLMYYGLQAYYRSLGLVVNQLVVLDEVMKLRLRKLIKSTPISVQPLWIDSPIDQLQTKPDHNLTESLKVLSFGFVSFYKGSDWLASVAQKTTNMKCMNGVSFVLAGGSPQELKHKSYMQQNSLGNQFFNRIKRISQKVNNLIMTGFLSDRAVGKWMKKADIIVFPYRNLMGGSASLQTAIRFNKPVLLSTTMLDLLVGSNVVVRAMEEAGLTQKELAFDMSDDSLITLLVKYRTNGAYRKRLAHFSSHLRKSLSMADLLPQHYQEVYANADEKMVTLNRCELVTE